MARKLTLASLLLFFCSFVYAQPPVEMADGMRSNGKIYVVVAVVVTILAGLLFYLIRLDRKMTKIENHITTK